MWKLAVGAVLLLAGELWGVPTKYTFPADTVVTKKLIADSVTATAMTVSDSARFAKFRATAWGMSAVQGRISAGARRSLTASTQTMVVDLGAGGVMVENSLGHIAIGVNAKLGAAGVPLNLAHAATGPAAAICLEPTTTQGISFYFSPTTAAGGGLSGAAPVVVSRGISTTTPVLNVTAAAGDSTTPIFKITSTGSAGTDTTKKFASFIANTTEKFYVASTGGVYNNGTYGAVSDSSLKTDIKDAVDVSTGLKSLKIKTFRFKDEVNKIHTGVVAQDVQAIYPELVELVPLGRDSSWTDENGVTQHKKVDVPTLVVNMQGFIPVLIAHAQEQDRSILELQTAVAGLLTALAGLGALVQSLRKKLNALIALHPEAGVTEEEK